MNQLHVKGYVRNVTQTMQSRSGSTNYFNFSVQVTDTRKRRAACYDTTKQSLITGFQDSRQPASLFNITEKPSLLDPSEQHLILGKKSRIEPVNNDDITFHYDDTAPPENQPILTTVDKVRLLDENQLTTVKGALTIRTDSMREVIIKNGFLAPILDRCTITNNSGTIAVTLWTDLIKQVANEKSYSITHVSVKQYDSKKYLTTTPSTTITPIDEHYSPPTNKFFDSLFDAKTVSADRIRFADTFKTWLSCSKCQNILPEAASASNTVLKCPNCNAFQPASSCSTNASVRIAVRENNHDLVWLKVFTPHLLEMLSHSATDVNLQSPQENIYEQLFQLRNFTLHYSKTSDIVKSIYFDTSE